MERIPEADAQKLVVNRKKPNRFGHWLPRRKSGIEALYFQED